MHLPWVKACKQKCLFISLPNSCVILLCSIELWDSLISYMLLANILVLVRIYLRNVSWNVEMLKCLCVYPLLVIFCLLIFSTILCCDPCHVRCLLGVFMRTGIEIGSDYMLQLYIGWIGLHVTTILRLDRIVLCNGIEVGLGCAPQHI